MRALSLMTLLFLLYSPAALASCVPWIAHGETLLTANTLLTNPAPQLNGLQGEFASLPYTVPSNKKLTVNYLSLEGITGATIYVWVGSGSFAANVVIQGFTAPAITGGAGTGPGTPEWGPTFVFPVSTIVNIELLGSQSLVYGWVISGTLCDVP
jgi:hypothetical protein